MTSFARWLKTFVGTRTQRPRRRHSGLSLELLEDRVVPATFVVTNLSDDPSAPAGSLRAAISAANADTNPDPDTITFAPHLTGTITLNSALPALVGSGPLTIQGPGPAARFLSISRNTAAGTPQFRIFDVAAGATVTLADLTIENGHAPDGAGNGDNWGGGIRNDGTLTILRSVLRNNAAGDGADGANGANGNNGSSGFNGGHGTDGFAGEQGAPGGNGGGIYNTSQGVLRLDSSTLTGNRAGRGGNGGAGGNGGNGANAGATGGNGGHGGGAGGGGAGGSGGGLFSRGSVTIVSSTFHDNVPGVGGNGGAGGRGGNGGGATDPGDGGNGGGGGGGAGHGGGWNILSASSLRIDNSTLTISSGVAAGSGGGGGGGGTRGSGIGSARNGSSGEGGAGGLEDIGRNGGVGSPHSGQKGSDATLGIGTGTGLVNVAQVTGTASVANSIFDNKVFGAFVSGGSNLVGDVGSSTGFHLFDYRNVAPQLGPLQDNGGSTPTRAPLPGSPALNAANNPLALALDQRGFPRVFGHALDVGAFEVSPPVVITPTAGLETSIAGGFADFTIRLGIPPVTRATIGLLSSNTAAGIPSINFLFFDATNWTIPQTVRVTGRDHGGTADVNYTILTSILSADPLFNNIDIEDVKVTNRFVPPGVTFTQAENLTTTETGGTATFLVVLQSPPRTDVTLVFTSSDTSEGTVTPSVTFTASNWNVPQRVTLTGVNDNVHDGNSSYSIRTTIDSANADYVNLQPGDIEVSNLSVHLESDPLRLGRTVLVVPGTDGDDVILINRATRPGHVEVLVNGVSYGVFRPTSRIAVAGGAGNDRIEANRRVSRSAWLDGGDGDDTLIGGRGADVLRGGTGQDTLMGNGGRDVLIGGTEADALTGGGADDLLIGGTTIHDANEAALVAVLSEWKSARPFERRQANLLGSGSVRRLNADFFLREAVDVLDDGFADTSSTDNLGRDWVFSNS